MPPPQTAALGLVRQGGRFLTRSAFLAALAAVIFFVAPVSGYGGALTDIVAARSVVAQGDWKTAADPLARLVAQSPDNGEFRIDLARAHYYLGQFGEAESDYRAAFVLKAVDPAIAAYDVAKGQRAGRRSAVHASL